MKRGHCSTFAVPHTSISITPLSSGTAPCPSASAAGAAPASCGMEEVLRDPPCSLEQGLCHPTGGEAAPAGCKSPGAAAGCDSADPAPPQGPASPRRARLLRESASSAERQGRASTAPPPATSTCPSLRDRARSCSNGASPPGAHPGRKGFLPGTARLASPTPPCP